MQSEAKRRVKRVAAQIRKAIDRIEGERLEPFERDEMIYSIDDVIEEARRQRRVATARKRG